MRRDDLLELARRCEVEKPSRQLDAAIMAAKLGAGWTVSAANGWVCIPHLEIVEAPPFTTSLDATVRPEGDDVFWRSGHDGEGPDPSLFRADVLLAFTRGAQFTGRARTEAMARRAAELRALAATAQP